MTRAFVAIKPPEPVLDAVAARTATFELPGAKRTPRAQWHITVQFLGNDADVDAVIESLADLRTPAERVQLAGVGGLDAVRTRAYVLAVFPRPLEWLQGLAEEVAGCVRPLGHEPDHRRFVPHLTLARCKKRTNMEAAMEAVGP